MSKVTIDAGAEPAQQYRIDSFSVPEAVREEFLAAMRRNMAFIETLPGFVGHVVFEKEGGPSSFNLVTIAVWESTRALEAARERVFAYYEEIGFDPPAQMARWGVVGEVGQYAAPRVLQ